MNNTTVVESTATESILDLTSESSFEYVTNAAIGLAFLATAVIAGHRISSSRSNTGAETTVVTAFYTLILMTASLRALWFLLPNSLLEPSYTPTGVMAFSKEYPNWFGAYLSEEILCFGSLGLFSIFLLILVYWADILKKYFDPGARRSKPMLTFITIVGNLAVIILINSIAFLWGMYSTEGMILLNALVLAIVSVICVVEISIFSHKFRTVLKTLGAINRVSTESQVKRIVWITVTGNAFFATRAVMEIWISGTLLFYWHTNGNVDKTFTHQFWDSYTLMKFLSEIAILCLMLYILKSRFATKAGYDTIPDAEDESEPPVNTAIVV